MAYFCRCQYCNLYLFDTSKTTLRISMADHQADKHSDKPFQIFPVKISARQYRDFILNRDHPAFWQTMRLLLKTTKVEARLKAIPFSLIGVREIKPFCKL